MPFLCQFFVSPLGFSQVYLHSTLNLQCIKYLPGPVLGVGGTMVNKISQIPVLINVIFQWRRPDINKVIKQINGFVVTNNLW